MSLEIDCGFKNKRKKVKITYEDLPSFLFSMDKDELLKLKSLEVNFLTEGPKSLKIFEKFYLDYPKSLYAAVIYFQALRTFEYFEEAKQLFNSIKKKFPNEIMTLCIDAHYALEEGNKEKFLKLFADKEILKIAFPKRSLYHYKEALCFHSMWAFYWKIEKNTEQMAKHQKFIALLLNTLKTFSSAGQNWC